MTSKGTFTLPVKIRRLFGLHKAGDKLSIRFEPATQQAILTKPRSFRELQETTAKYIKSGRKPLTDVSGYYQAAKSEKRRG